VAAAEAGLCSVAAEAAAAGAALNGKVGAAPARVPRAPASCKPCSSVAAGFVCT